MNNRLWLAAVLAVGGASTSSCGGDNSASEGETVGHGAPAASAGNEDPAESSEQWLSPAQIMSVTTATNTGEVAQANAALSKLTTTDATQFAKMMVEMHTAAQQRQEAMAQDKGLIPAAHPLSTELAQDSDDILAEISAADRDDIDALYMEKQVEVHEKVLKSMDEVLIPSATDPALQQELQTARAEVASHLQRAREIVNKLD